ncbi:MAG: hypothetical protein ACTSVG_13595 [Alphaproteobacteria bacterium]
MNVFPKRAGIALGAMALVLAGCGGGGDDEPSAATAHALPNISLAGSPNATVVGLVDPHQATALASVEGHVIIAAFRARACGQPAPDFAKLMRREIEDGFRVPDGITLYDAGIGHYTSSRCGQNTQALAIGAYAYKRGTYQVRFFGGKTTRTLTVR